MFVNSIWCESKLCIATKIRLHQSRSEVEASVLRGWETVFPEHRGGPGPDQGHGSN